METNKTPYGNVRFKVAKACGQVYALCPQPHQFSPHGPAGAKIFGIVDTIYRQYTTRIDTGPLNQILERAVAHNAPPMHLGRRMKFFYATQVEISPPTVVCFVSHPEAVHFSYQRYLLNQIRQQTGLDATPIRIIFKGRSGRKALSEMFDKRGPQKRIPKRLRRR